MKKQMIVIAATLWLAAYPGLQALAQAPAAPNAPPAQAALPAPPAPRAQAHDANAPVPPAQHRSALRPRSADAVPVGSWSEANRVVDEVGGWKAYLKEAHSQPKEPEKTK